MEQVKRLKYQCPKCDCKTCTVDEFRAVGGFWTKVFDIQNKRFTTLTCTRCSYTEIYRMNQSQLGNVIDFIIG